jgi:hemoglobin
VQGPDAEANIRTLVFSFYDRVRDDTLLGPVFEEHLQGGWDAHLSRMCDFWSSVLLGTGRFRGDPIGTHARIPGLTSAHFDRWVMLFGQTAAEVFSPPEAAYVLERGTRIRAVLEHRTVPGAEQLT